MPNLTPDLIATFAALLFAHLLADFVLQTRAMVDNKRNPFVFLLHIAIHGAVTWAVLGGLWAVALFVALSHFIIDVIKTFFLPDRLWAFCVDQIAHLAALIALALWLPNSYGTGLWAGSINPSLWIILSGAIAATFAGGPAIGYLMRRFPLDQSASDALPDAGRVIGLLERTLIFVLVYIGEPSAVGFLIAAKSVLRFDTISQGRGASEYVIVGTLASFAWAMLAALATVASLSYLAP